MNSGTTKRVARIANRITRSDVSPPIGSHRRRCTPSGGGMARDAMVQRAATTAISSFHSGRASAGTVTSVDAARWPARASSRRAHHHREIVGERGGVDDIGRDRHDVLRAEHRLVEHRHDVRPHDRRLFADRRRHGAVGCDRHDAGGVEPAGGGFGQHRVRIVGDRAGDRRRGDLGRHPSILHGRHERLARFDRSRHTILRDNGSEARCRT